MANKRIKDLPEATSTSAGDVVAIDNLTTQKITVENMIGENLASFKGLTSAADKGIQFTGSDGSTATYDLTEAAKALLDDADAAAMLTTLGVSTFVQTLLDDASASAFLTTLGVSTYIKTLLDDADAAATRTTLGVAIGTDVQAQSARLADIAGISWAQGDLLYHNGSNLVRLPAGTSGNFLKTQGTGANPAWATLTGGGDMLAANNLSDLDDAGDARTNLGATTVGDAVFTATDAAAARTAVGLSGALSNARLAKTAAYTLLNADKGKTIALGGSAFYTLTVNAASGYDADFCVMLVNEDTARAKTIAVNGLLNFFLYPGQSIILFNQNNVWRVHGQSRWKLTGGTINLYSDFTNGNDANDGLAAGSGNAKKTVQACLDSIANDFDFGALSGLLSGTFGSQTLAVVNMAANTVDTQGVHFSSHAIVGAQGGAAIKILGTTGSGINTTGTDALGFFCNVQIQISGVALNTFTSGSCINADLGAQVDIIGPVTFGACAGSHMSASRGGRIYIDANYTVAGNATTAHIIAQTPGGYVTGNTITVTIAANISVGWWVLASNMGCANLVNFTFSLGAFSVAGKRYEADNLALIATNNGTANYFPGNAAGSTLGGGQYV